MNEIVMPKLSDTMTEGRLVSWKKRVGEAVRRGEVLAEVETDKANMELESFVSGDLLETRVEEGDMVQVGTVIAVVGKAGEKGEEGRQPAKPHEEAEEGEGAKPAPRQETASEEEEASRQERPEAAPEEEHPPREKPEAPPEGQPPAATAGEPAREADIVQMEGERQAPAAAPEPGGEETQPAGRPGEPYRPLPPGEKKRPTKPAPMEAGGGRERAAPVVRRRARELGIDLGEISGSGPEGRILLQDLERYQKEPGAEKARPAEKRAEEAQPAGPSPVKGVTPMPRLRAAIARTVTESWGKIPHFTVTIDIAMDQAEGIRQQLKQADMHVSVNDMVVKAVALALEKFPQMNARYAEEGMQFHDEINISIAVGVPDGVVMPVLNGCQRRSLLEISREASRLVERTRAGNLGEQDMTGGTFAVSNLGMYGVESFSAVIHPAQSGVLAVGAVKETPVSRGGLLTSAKIMKVTLSADHRVVDGAYAAQFLAELKKVMETPVRLLI